MISLLALDLVSVLSLVDDNDGGPLGCRNTVSRSGWPLSEHSIRSINEVGAVDCTADALGLKLVLGESNIFGLV